MWIVKIGGSLCADPVLVQWLELLTQVGGGRVTIVCGGGSFADEVRRIQAHWQLNDLAAHNMAVLAMAQTAYQLHALNPALQLAARKTDIPDLLRRGKTALWLPLEQRRDRPDARTSWEATSDTMALDLAKHLNAEQLVMVKSCAIDPQLTLAQLGEAGVVDPQFAEASSDAAFPITLLHKSQVSTMRALLLGEASFASR
ncbi:aspartate kinase [Variovorax paradoxus]|nr:aspartate kinase [Variovorax paradoxus]